LHYVVFRFLKQFNVHNVTVTEKVYSAYIVILCHGLTKDKDAYLCCGP
jgi:hypothetical protein